LLLFGLDGVEVSLDLVLAKQAARAATWAGERSSGRSASPSTPPTGTTAEVSALAASDAIAARARCSSSTASRNAQANFSQYPPGCSAVSIDRQHQSVARSSHASSVTAPACRTAASASDFDPQPNVRP
jgi:hypothetical protein